MEESLRETRRPRLCLIPLRSVHDDKWVASVHMIVFFKESGYLKLVSWWENDEYTNM